ncbi:hypothetical protein DFH09DRAFT_1246182 [Mycena vulgaris]|nr:hypothetical protein DFH09DRAFT_1246182 [Mycena vulgaris]
MTVIPWDGQSPRPLVDKGGRVIAVLGGRPKGRDYLKQTQEAARQLEDARGELKFRADQVNGRRGAFSSVSYGISYGGGQQVPGNLAHPSPMCQVLERLFSLACFFRIAGFANGLFKTWNPAVHAFYTLTLDALTFDYNPSLRRNFLRQYSSFAAATLTFGPATFDPIRGGHLVLWDLKLVICFPPGSTILIPSAVLRHSNVGIAPAESRYSFTQFTAAGLFRWVDNVFKSDVTVAEESRYDEDAQDARERARRTR